MGREKVVLAKLGCYTDIMVLYGDVRLAYDSSEPKRLVSN